MKALTWISGIVNALLLLATSADAFFSESGVSSQSVSSKIDIFKASLHRTLEGLRIRKKRKAEVPYDASAYQKRIDTSAEEDLPYLSGYQVAFWVPVEHPTRAQILVGTREGNLLLFQISEKDDREAELLASSYEGEVGLKAKAFNYFDEQWFIVLHSARNQTWIRLYVRQGRGLEEQQTIPLKGKTDFDLVAMKGVYYMAVSSYQSLRNQASLTLYHWTQTQFDVIASRTVYGPRSITCWVLDGTLYMALAQRIDGMEASQYGSPIFLYNAKDELGLVMQQMLSIVGPIKVLHFYVNSNHYVIFIGSQEATIYWWTSNQFLLWQVIPNTANAVDASILTLVSGEVIIVIVLKERVLFATLDSSGHYFVSSEMRFDGSSLYSVQFMYSGRAYYALALSETASYSLQKQPIWKLTWGSYYLPTGNSLDSLRQCLNNVAEALDDRQAEMTNIQVDLSRVWLKNKEQRITAEVFIDGKTSSNQKSIVTEILIVLKEKKLPQLSLPDIEERRSRLSSIINSIQQKVLGSVRKSTPQNFTGTLYFRDPISIPSLVLNSAQSDIPINDVLVSRINQYALRSKGNQVFPYPMYVTNICATAVTADYINGIQTDDLLLLKGVQQVKGRLTFADMNVKSILANSVNAIPISHFVKTSGEQTIRGLKSLSNLNSDDISVSGEMNGVILREIISKIVRLDTDDELKKPVTLNAISEIRGDLFLIGKINGEVDIYRLASESVLKNGPQELKGLLTFTPPVKVLKDVTVSGKVNNIYTNELFTLSSNQTISGNLAFDDFLVVDGDLDVITINDLNLRSEVVLKEGEPQFVLGLKAFTNVVQTDFIDMSEYTELDGVDPSLFVQDIVKHKEGLVKESRTIFPHAVVLGNLTVTEGINGRDVFDLPGSVLLRKTPQVIDIPIGLKEVAANHMFVTKVNNIDIDSDVVYSYGDETITSFKVFNNVITSKVDTTDSAMLNGIQVVSFKTELSDYMEGGTVEEIVQGTKTIDYLEIDGDLIASLLNNFDVFANVLRPNDYQVLSAPVEFPSELMVINDNLPSHDVTFNLFNSVDLRSFLEDAVLKTTLKKGVKNKNFPRVKAQSLSVPEGNTINGIPVSDLLKRVVTLNTKQEVVGKTFKSDLVSKALGVSSLNGKEFSSLINDIVFLDKNEQVTSKTFDGSFVIPNLFIKEPINGVDIEYLNEYAFNRFRHNDVLYGVNFLNSIDVENFITGFGLDGINWSDLIYTKSEESLDSLKLMSKANVFADIFVKGLVNGCDLMELERNALYAKKEKQIIQEEITIESIQVIGNVQIEDVVNEVPVQNLIKKLILVKDNQVVTSDVVLETGTEIKNLNLGNVLEDLNLDFILKDAVMQSKPKVITGYKKFHSLVTNVLEAPGLFVSGQLQNINISELYNGVVWKDGEQIIEEEKIFGTLKADVASVQGHLNGLKFPDDVVMAGMSEHISSPTFFMSDLILATDLIVHGKLDGISLSNLLSNLVTLSTDQNVSSKLFFRSDAKVIGNIEIDGTVNDLVLETVVKKSQNVPINGFKIFIEDFHILRSLKAPLINGHNIKQLDQSIMKHYEEEFVTDLQIFEKPIKARSHIFVEWINNISLPGITSTFFSLVDTVKKTLNLIEDMSYNILQQLRSQMNMVGGNVSKFAYFILLQEINIGPTVKILKGYRPEHPSSEFSHSMVIWTSQEQCSYLEKCCHEEFSHWMRVKKSGHLIVDSQPEPGRLYPIHNSVPGTTDKDFFIWTNTTGYQPKWCGDRQDRKMILASLTDLKYLEVLLDIKNAPTLSDIKSFRRGHLYAVAGFYYNREEDIYSNAVVYVFNEAKREWAEHQILPTIGVLSLDLITTSADEVLLALGTGTDSYSSVYKWNDNTYKFYLLQSISSRFVTSTLWLKQGSTQLLAMANVEKWPRREAFCSEIISGGEINIYAYSNNMKWVQNIPLSGVISLEYFALEGDVFLVAASSKLQTVYIYEWRGYAGFTYVQSMFVGEVTHLNTYRIEKDLYMTVATASGPAKVLKVVLQGKQTVGPSIRDDLLLDTQKDEALKDKSDC